MTVFSKRLQLVSNGQRTTYHNISEQVREAVKESQITDGICVVASTHTTCSVIFEEFAHDRNFYGDEYLQVDLNETLEKIIPKCLTENQYNHPGPEHVTFAEDIMHADRKYTLNTDAHLKASFFGSSETFTINDGQLDLGGLGSIYFVDLDHQRVRTRNCQIKIMGE
jgi:secondary thiamine-phosphate synthase enzyme